MIILGIETSCDDTCAALVKDGLEVLSNVVSSQDEVHRKYGGVVPEIASRHHDCCIGPVFREALERAACSPEQVDAVAVTTHPGLIGSLLVGVSFAKALAFAWGKPLLGVSHLEGHLYAPFLHTSPDHPALEFEPHVGLVASGGHTALYFVKTPTENEELAPTLDDAVGEAFDKVSKLLGLPYPGGPALERTAREYQGELLPLPRPSSRRNPLAFSMSGLKTAVLNHVKAVENEGKTPEIPRIAASFQEAVGDVIREKTLAAARDIGVRLVTFSGGVAANRFIRDRLDKGCSEAGLRFVSPPMAYCTDNASMIAGLGYHYLKEGKVSSWDIGPVASRRN